MAGTWQKGGGMRGGVSMLSAHCRDNLLKNSPELPYSKIIFILLLKTLLLYKLTILAVIGKVKTLKH